MSREYWFLVSVSPSPTPISESDAARDSRFPCPDSRPTGHNLTQSSDTTLFSLGQQRQVLDDTFELPVAV